MAAAKLLKIVGLSELYSPPPTPSPTPPLTPSPSTNDINYISDKDQRSKMENVNHSDPKLIVPISPPISSNNDHDKIASYEPIELLQEQPKNRDDPLQDFIEGLLMVKQESLTDQTAEPITSFTPPPEVEDHPVLQFTTPSKSPNTIHVSASMNCLDQYGGMENNSRHLVSTGQEANLSHVSQPKMYHCQQCDYKSAKQYNVKKHTLSVHEKIRYPCTFCKYQATETGHLKKHIRTVHKDIELDTSVPAIQQQ